MGLGYENAWMAVAIAAIAVLEIVHYFDVKSAREWTVIMYVFGGMIFGATFIVSNFLQDSVSGTFSMSRETFTVTTVVATPLAVVAIALTYYFDKKYVKGSNLNERLTGISYMVIAGILLSANPVGVKLAEWTGAFLDWSQLDTLLKFFPRHPTVFWWVIGWWVFAAFVWPVFAGMLASRAAEKKMRKEAKKSNRAMAF